MAYHNTNTNLASSTEDIKESENTNDSLDSGVLSSDQTICYSTAPEEISFSQASSGGAGPGDYEYLW